MKYRSDFVTNSSDSSFIVDSIDNPLFDSFRNKLNIDDGLINSRNDWLVPGITDARSVSEWQLLKILLEEWNATMQFYLGGDDLEDLENGSEYENAIFRSMAEGGFISLKPEESVVDWLERGGLSELTESMGPFDEGIKSATIEVIRYADGGWGPFEYVRINKGKRLNICLREDDLDYHHYWCVSESVSGKEFVVSEDRYGDRDRIIDFILEQGGSVSEEITDNTHFVLCAEPGMQPVVSKAREECIPVLSEKGFWNRYSENKIECDPLDCAPWNVFNPEDAFINWLEETGLGIVSMQIWKDGKWQFCDKY